MGTVDKGFADNLAENNGYYNGDTDNSCGDNPRCVMIVEYDNCYGGVGYGLVFEDQYNKYYETEFVKSPRVYWEWKNK